MNEDDSSTKEFLETRVQFGKFSQFGVEIFFKKVPCYSKEMRKNMQIQILNGALSLPIFILRKKT